MMRGATSESSQRTSGAATKCSVPRMAQVRTKTLSAISRSTPASVLSGERRPIDHFAPA